MGCLLAGFGNSLFLLLGRGKDGDGQKRKGGAARGLSARASSAHPGGFQC